jgi:hypothetical protein
MSSLSASCLQPNGIAASDFARVQAARAKNGVARSRAAQPSSSPTAGPARRRRDEWTCVGTLPVWVLGTEARRGGTCSGRSGLGFVVSAVQVRSPVDGARRAPRASLGARQRIPSSRRPSLRQLIGSSSTRLASAARRFRAVRRGRAGDPFRPGVALFTDATKTRSMTPGKGRPKSSPQPRRAPSRWSLPRAVPPPARAGGRG